MRRDSIGFFWEDKPVVKEKKAPPVKRTPPERTWEQGGKYLPNLEAARKWNPDKYMPVHTMVALAQNKIKGLPRETLMFDIETYPNYTLIAFSHKGTGQHFYFEYDLEGYVFAPNWDMAMLKWVLDHFRIVGYNSEEFDCGILALALGGKGCQEMADYAQRNIAMRERQYKILKSYGVKALHKQCDLAHIDLMEVAPGVRISLKLYGARLGVKYMQDLPFKPGTFLNEDQITITRWYCLNDLDCTQLTYDALDKELSLREDLSRRYRKNMMSKSDAQIAEAIIGGQLEEITGRRPTVPMIIPGTVYHFNKPAPLVFQTETMKWVLDRVVNTEFEVGLDGKIAPPASLKGLKVNIGRTTYTMGIGGLHSTESKQCIVPNDDYEVFDVDAESFYPKLILTQGLYPMHLGPAFLEIFGGIVNERLEAKRTGDKRKSDSLKITINGTYGKLGSEYSFLFAPDLLIQTTLSGQLYLMMLIERLELAGIHVMSGNTDGIMVVCHKSKREQMKQIVKQWEIDVDFKTDEAQYRAVYSANVNNYIAIKKNGEVKTKGWFAEQGIRKSPATQVCVDALIENLLNGTPYEKTIRGCTDFTRFIRVHQAGKGAGVVSLGSAEDGGNELLGKVARWYYATGEQPELVVLLNGHTVPRSEGAKPAMTFGEFPEDIDWDWYVKHTEELRATLMEIEA